MKGDQVFQTYVPQKLEARFPMPAPPDDENAVPAAVDPVNEPVSKT